MPTSRRRIGIVATPISLEPRGTMSTDLSDLPPSTPEEIRAMTQRAGLDLPEELMQRIN